MEHVQTFANLSHDALAFPANLDWQQIPLQSLLRDSPLRLKSSILNLLKVDHPPESITNGVWNAILAQYFPYPRFIIAPEFLYKEPKEGRRWKQSKPDLIVIRFSDQRTVLVLEGKDLIREDAPRMVDFKAVIQLEMSILAVKRSNGDGVGSVSNETCGLLVGGTKVYARCAWDQDTMTGHTVEERVKEGDLRDIDPYNDRETESDTDSNAESNTNPETHSDTSSHTDFDTETDTDSATESATSSEDADMSLFEIHRLLRCIAWGLKLICSHEWPWDPEVFSYALELIAPDLSMIPPQS